MQLAAFDVTAQAFREVKRRRPTTSLVAQQLHRVSRSPIKIARQLSSAIAAQQACLPATPARGSVVVVLNLAISILLTASTLPAHARVVTERFGQGELQESRSKGGDLQELFRKQKNYQNSQGSPGAPPDVKLQVNEVLRLSSEAKQAIADANYAKALEDYAQIKLRFPELAITQYARLGHAMLLYQTGSTEQAILELEDLEVDLRGSAEVHAALASIIYAARPSEISYAEQQFDLASEFDQRYSDVLWVKTAKTWPPAMLSALDKFVNLK